MISIADIELIENILKWNSTAEIDTEVLTDDVKGNMNLTGHVYHIINGLSENTVYNETKDKTNNFTNSSENTVPVNEYDIFEASVVTILFLLIVITVIGNTLIISAVVTTKRLRTVTNCFVTSLAAADLLVGIFVMPPAIAVHISGK